MACFLGFYNIYICYKIRWVTSNNVKIVLDIESKEQIDKIYIKVKELKCKIRMEFQQTFWGEYYARFEVPIGIGWQLNFRESE
jgi:PhnB protein